MYCSRDIRVLFIKLGHSIWNMVIFTVHQKFLFYFRIQFNFLQLFPERFQSIQLNSVEFKRPPPDQKGSFLMWLPALNVFIQKSPTSMGCAWTRNNEIVCMVQCSDFVIFVELFIILYFCMKTIFWVFSFTIRSYSAKRFIYKSVSSWGEINKNYFPKITINV